MFSNVLMHKQLLRFIMLVALFSCKQSADKKQKPPNVLIFMADDMTWSDCSPYGNTDVFTPNIQKLANEGLCFDNMFTSTAMCAPTRQQILTGLFPVRSGAFPNHSKVYKGVKSLGHHFGALGYEVVVIGKKHFGPDSSYPLQYIPFRQHDDGKDGREIHLDSLKRIIEGEKPFFIIVAQNQPHKPWNRGDTTQYDPKSIKVPKNFVDNAKTRSEMVKYYAEITYADSLLGKSLELVERANKTDNTISIFTSEQGSQFPFAKWTCYDQGLKTAFIVKWPGKIKP
ncbi:MAG: sulfatase-like hydrolase/transferase, partial [Bacteroidota bacterium]